VNGEETFRSGRVRGQIEGRGRERERETETETEKG